MRKKLFKIIFTFFYICCLPSSAWTAYTNTEFINLVISATDQGSGTGSGAEMQFSNDGVNWSDSELFSTLKNNWNVTTHGGKQEDGRKVIYIKIKDLANNWSTGPITTSVILDRAAPVTSTTPAGANYNAAVQVTISSNEYADVYYTTDGTTPTRSSDKYIDPIVLFQTTTLQYFAEDPAGNQGNIITEIFNITLDHIMDTDGDGMPDWWEEEYGLDPNTNDANLDSDNDGSANISEYLAGGNPTHYALTIYVDDDAPAGGDGSEGNPFNNIYQAIEYAIAGDTVFVLEGYYPENQVLVVKDGVDLIGETGHLCDIDLKGTGFIDGANNSTISGFKIFNPRDDMGAISCAGTSPIIYNNVIIPSTSGAAGILLIDSSAAKIYNNTIVDAFIGIEIDSASPIIMNNTIVENVLGIMQHSGNPLIDYNNIWGSEGTAPCPDGNYCGSNPGVNDISEDPTIWTPNKLLR